MFKENQWNYDTYAADAWQAEFSGCKGSGQSPISVALDDLEYEPKLAPFNFNLYDKTYDWVVSNENMTCN